MDLGSFVRMKRREQNLSQTQLAEKAGVGLNFVYQLEKNKPTVQLNCARQVLNALGFDIGIDDIAAHAPVSGQPDRQGASSDKTPPYTLPW